MSIMCCRVPEFLMGLAERDKPELQGKPVALVGTDELVCAVSSEARQSGVTLQMEPRQARMRCPDVQLHPVDMEASQAQQGAFVGKLAECGLPVEAPSWGVAYVDLHAVATTSLTVQPLCGDLGKQARGVLGEDLVPSIGWDTSKFTARAAASTATPGHMRLVDHTSEEHFLRPLSIALLPLSPLALQQLTWLGIRTLGQFAKLPKTAVWQRFGAEGKLAQAWAQGRDDRPVRRTIEEVSPPLSINFDPPTGLHGDVLEAVLSNLRPSLSALARRLEGCRRLRLDLHFNDDSTRHIDHTFVEPVVEESRLRATISHQLEILNWPGELAFLNLSLLECGELMPHQLMLFDLDTERSALVQLAEKLSGRYREIFFRLSMSDERHPLSERRSTMNLLVAGQAI